MNICIIPARGGSKRIPRKNIKPFCGKPIIAHAIDAALRSRLFDHIIVSTDDDEIVMLANTFGATTPFRRPQELADDYTPTIPVISHAVRACREMGWYVTRVCCIYPCVPFIRIEDLTAALALLETSGAPYSFPVVEFTSPIQRALKRDTAGCMSPLFPEHQLSRSQDLEPAFHDAGQFYWGWANSWLTAESVHSGAAGLTIPQWRVVDIDTPDDWTRAELMYHALHAEKGNTRT
jgi:pseudaminic acid cytidylyltransferase